MGMGEVWGDASGCDLVIWFVEGTPVQASTHVRDCDYIFWVFYSMQYNS